MNPRPRKVRWPFWAGVALLAATLLLAFLLAQLRYMASLGQPLPIYGPIANFTLTNELGGDVGLADLRGHVWVADLIFTRCAGPCLKMSRQMKDLQQALPPRSRARLVTLTTDPEYDTPPVLRAYAQRFGADTNRWLFLTGTRKQIADLAIGSLKLTSVEIQPEQRSSPQDLFLHSTIFVIADKHARLRGVFETEGAGVDPLQVQNRLIAAVRRLERER